MVTGCQKGVSRLSCIFSHSVGSSTDNHQQATPAHLIIFLNEDGFNEDKALAFKPVPKDIAVSLITIAGYIPDQQKLAIGTPWHRSFSSQHRELSPQPHIASQQSRSHVQQHRQKWSPDPEEHIDRTSYHSLFPLFLLHPHSSSKARASSTVMLRRREEGSAKLAQAPGSQMLLLRAPQGSVWSAGHIHLSQQSQKCLQQRRGSPSLNSKGSYKSFPQKTHLPLKAVKSSLFHLPTRLECSP